MCWIKSKNLLEQIEKIDLIPCFFLLILWRWFALSMSDDSPNFNILLLLHGHLTFGPMKRSSNRFHNLNTAQYTHSLLFENRLQTKLIRLGHNVKRTFETNHKKKKYSRSVWDVRFPFPTYPLQITKMIIIKVSFCSFYPWHIIWHTRTFTHIHTIFNSSTNEHI